MKPWKSSGIRQSTIHFKPYGRSRSPNLTANSRSKTVQHQFHAWADQLSGLGYQLLISFQARQSVARPVGAGRRTSVLYLGNGSLNLTAFMSLIFIYDAPYLVRRSWSSVIIVGVTFAAMTKE